jgi:hypothetical protein
MVGSKSSISRQQGWIAGLAFGLGLIAIFVLRIILEWPMALGFQNFIIRDTGSFRYVNTLLDMGLRPSVDFGFYYGMLGLMVQRIAFAVFGGGYWTTLGITAGVLALTVVFWWLLARELGFSWMNFAILLGLYEMMVGLAFSGPTPAHGLVRVLLAFSLLLALKGRLGLALVLAAFAALSIPSLPIILIGLLSVLIIFQWWQAPQRRLRDLAGQLAPALVVYGLGVLTFTIIFGLRSTLPSLFPIHGMALYRALNFGFFNSGENFWHPRGPTISYYLFNKAGIWLFCSALLVVFGVASLVRMVRSRKSSGAPLFIFLCCALHLFFIFFAYGNAGSWIFYEFILVAGVFAGVSELTKGRMRVVLSCLLLFFGLLSNRVEASHRRFPWRTWHRSAETAGLYAPDDFRREWAPIIQLANSHDLLFLSGGNGASTFFPRVKTPQSWFLLPGVALPPENAYVLDQIKKSDVVVEYTSESAWYIDQNVAWQAALAQFPVRLKGSYMRIWMRSALDADALVQTTDFRPEKVKTEPDQPK